MRPIVYALMIVVVVRSLQAHETTETPIIHGGGLSYINTHIENGSPLHWTIDRDRTVNVFLVYDQERDSVNRASEHWHFRVEGDKGAKLTFVLNKFHEIYNGRLGSSVSEKTIIVTSQDGKMWTPMAAGNHQVLPRWPVACTPAMEFLAVFRNSTPIGSPL